MRVAKLRATTAEWQSVYPWHFGGSIPSTGPVLGIDRLGRWQPVRDRSAAPGDRGSRDEPETWCWPARRATASRRSSRT